MFLSEAWLICLSPMLIGLIKVYIVDGLRSNNVSWKNSAVVSKVLDTTAESSYHNITPNPLNPLNQS